MDEFFMSTISSLNDYTSFLSGPLMPTLVHFQSIPQFGISSKSKLILCLSGLCCSHLHSQTPDTAMAPHSSWDDVQCHNTAHKVLCGLLLPPLASVLPTLLILRSLVPLISLQLCLFATLLPPQGLNPRRFLCLEHFLPSYSSFRSLCWAVFSDMAHTLTRSDPPW